MGKGGGRDRSDSALIKDPKDKLSLFGGMSPNREQWPAPHQTGRAMKSCTHLTAIVILTASGLRAKAKSVLTERRTTVGSNMHIN